MKKETHKITDKTESYAQQLPLSVAYYVNTNDEKTTRFLCRGVASNETFINMWLNMLFSDAQEIFQRQIAYYDSLNIPDYILNKISFDKNKYNISVKVIDFNSKKFDINIFLNHITISITTTVSISININFNFLETLFLFHLMKNLLSLHLEILIHYKFPTSLFRLI
jgi:hypothetical protein